MQRQDTPSSEAKRPELNVNVISGVFTSTFCTGLMNPWDRALYLAVKNQRRFLMSANFINPYQGLSQALMQRALFGGVYYTVQGQLRQDVYPYLRHDLNCSEPAANFVIGIAAGAINGVATNSLATIKYHSWNHENCTFLNAISDMWRSGGMRPFIKGTRATVLRDMAFGTTYEVLRHAIPSTDQNDVQQFMSNTAAAAAANIVSGPLNFARSLQYATPPHLTPLSISGILQNVWQDSKKVKALKRFGFFQQRFQVGWGTARVAVGMAMGQKVFELAQDALTSQQSARKN